MTDCFGIAYIICYSCTDQLQANRPREEVHRRSKRSHKRFSEWYPFSGSAQQSRNRVTGNQFQPPPGKVLAVDKYPNQSNFPAPGGAGFKSLKVE